MNLKTAKKLKFGDMLNHISKKNVNGTPMRAKVTSVKTWKRSPDKIEIHVKHGLYDFATFTENELDQLIAPLKYIQVKESELIFNPLWFHKRNLMQTSTGYGNKLSTVSMMIHNRRKKRIYCRCFSNCGTCYIVYKGEELIVEVIGGE